MHLYVVHPDQIDPKIGGPVLPVLWPHIEHLIDKGCKNARGEMTPDAIRMAVENGDVQLWVIADEKQKGPNRFRAVLVTELRVTMSGQKIGYILMIGGYGRKDWLHLLDELARWARREGCAKLRGFMRRGWEKDLPQFRKTASVMEMSLWEAEEKPSSPTSPGKH